MILAIYGTGGAGRSVYEVVRSNEKEKPAWENIIFIDDFNYDRIVHGLNVYSFEETVQKYDPRSILFSISTGEPEARSFLKNKVTNHGYSLADIIHHNTYIAQSSRHGNGLVLREGARISNDSVMGGNNSFENYSIFGHDSTMGDNCQISAFTVIAGNCRIGNNVFFGASSAVMQGVSIGSDTIISMGAMVFKDIPDGVIVSGNPARVIQKNTEKKVFKSPNHNKSS